MSTWLHIPPPVRTAEDQLYAWRITIQGAQGGIVYTVTRDPDAAAHMAANVGYLDPIADPDGVPLGLDRKRYDTSRLTVTSLPHVH